MARSQPNTWPGKSRSQKTFSCRRRFSVDFQGMNALVSGCSQCASCGTWRLQETEARDRPGNFRTVQAEKDRVKAGERLSVPDPETCSTDLMAAAQLSQHSEHLVDVESCAKESEHRKP